MAEKSLSERVLELILKSGKQIDIAELPEHIERIGQALRTLDGLASGAPTGAHPPPGKPGGHGKKRAASRETATPVPLPSPAATPTPPAPAAIIRSYKGARHPNDPAVPIEQSVTPEYIVCLEDGQHLKMLKRYLKTRYNMDVEEYREKWGLPKDYPTIAPNYALYRSRVAQKSGFGAQKA